MQLSTLKIYRLFEKYLAPFSFPFRFSLHFAQRTRTLNVPFWILFRDRKRKFQSQEGSQKVNGAQALLQFDEFFLFYWHAISKITASK